MRLHEFILSHREPILVEWEAFARTCSPAAGTMDVAALRDHAGAMLTTIAKDLMTVQGGADQAEKSKGLAPDPAPEATTAAESHGAGRAESGFTISQMVAEYRALRASVIRLWTRAQGELGPDEIEDLTRFNEAIDQSLAESIHEFDENVEHAKEMFIAILGHDLRTPLGAIYTSAQFMVGTGELVEPHRTLTTRIADSATRTIAMVGDLLDFTRSRLGGGIHVTAARAELGKILRGVVDEIGALHPERRIETAAPTEEWGEWDAGRLSQAFTNLVGNAVEHGAPGTTVTIRLGGDKDNVTVALHNRGAPIAADQLDGLFNPMKVRRTPQAASQSGPAGNLGLGLYISERIVQAHGGNIEVDSSEAGGTTFTVWLPRRAAA